MSATVHVADCRDFMRGMEPDSIDAIVTDPPYHLTSIVQRFGSPDAAPAKGDVYARASRGFMGQTWDGGDVAFDPETWRLALRVLKPGGHLLAFGGARTYHRLAAAIEDAGFEVRDQIMWLYSSGFPKSLDVSKAIDKAAGAEREVIQERTLNNNRFAVSGDGKEQEQFRKFAGNANITAPATEAARQWQGWGSALKPSHEPIVLARKPLSEPTIAGNVLRWSTGGLNIEACRVGAWTDADLRNMAVSSRGDSKGSVAFGFRGSDEPLTANPAGRWPANVIHSGDEEVLAAFAAFGSDKGQGFRTSKPGANPDSYSGKFQGDRGPRNGGDTGTAARFFMACPPDTPIERGDGMRFVYEPKASKADRMGTTHPTTKPTSLIQYLARLITPPGGTILDPFAGSGTLAVAAHREGFNAILIEQNPEYAEMIEKRLAVVRTEQEARKPKPNAADPLPLLSWLEAAE